MRLHEATVVSWAIIGTYVTIRTITRFFATLGATKTCRHVCTVNVTAMVHDRRRRQLEAQIWPNQLLCRGCWRCAPVTSTCCLLACLQQQQETRHHPSHGHHASHGHHEPRKHCSQTCWQALLLSDSSQPWQVGLRGLHTSPAGSSVFCILCQRDLPRGRLSLLQCPSSLGGLTQSFCCAASNFRLISEAVISQRYAAQSQKPF